MTASALSHHPALTSSRAVAAHLSRSAWSDLRVTSLALGGGGSDASNGLSDGPTPNLWRGRRLGWEQQLQLVCTLHSVAVCHVRSGQAHAETSSGRQAQGTLLALVQERA